MLKILVTGASGYVGREFIRSVQNKYHVVALVRESSDIYELKQINCEVEVFCTYDDIFNIFDKHKIDGIVHFASMVLVEHTRKDLEGMIDSNIIFGTYLLEASQYFDVKWFINTGTFWQNYDGNNYTPVNLYASTKEAFEKIASYYADIGNLTFVTIKLNDVFGPNDNRAKIFNLLLRSLKTGEKLEMSPGNQIIDISYISDVVGAYISLITILENGNDISRVKNKSFVVSNKNKVTLREFVDILQNITKSKLNITWGAKEYRVREVMNPYSLGDPVPGWHQRFSLHDAMLEIVNNTNTEYE